MSKVTKIVLMQPTKKNILLYFGEYGFVYFKKNVYKKSSVQICNLKNEERPRFLCVTNRMVRKWESNRKYYLVINREVLTEKYQYL